MEYVKRSFRKVSTLEKFLSSGEVSIRVCQKSCFWGPERASEYHF